MNVLVVAAHPDDEIIGVGGTLAKHVQNGDTVYAVIMGDGKSSRKTAYEVPDSQTLDHSNQEMKEAAEAIGLKEVYRHDLPDNRFDSIPLLDVVKIVEKHIEEIDPEVVYTHFGGDINIDHGVTFRAVMTATRLIPGTKIKAVYAYETLSSTEWNYETAFRPYFVDITNQLDIKLALMSKYQSELREFPHPRSLGAIEHNAKAWGARAGFLAAEPFILVRGINKEVLMILQMPYYGLDTEQIDLNWVEKGLGLEAHIFNGNDFLRDNFWIDFENKLKFAKSLNPSLLTLHFPTDNGNYFGCKAVHEHLLHMVELANKYHIEGITVHANQFLSINEWLQYPLEQERNRLLEYYSELDRQIQGSEVWIGVENLPIIGNQGIDFDPVFIYPEDFLEFSEKNYNNIFITWDICHWGITYLTHQSTSAMYRQSNAHKQFDKFLNLNKIKHFHMASFQKLAFPYSSVLCQEGVTPAEGDLDKNLLVDVIKKIDSQFDKNIGMVLELHEENYQQRKRAWEMADWFSHLTKGVPV